MENYSDQRICPAMCLPAGVPGQPNGELNNVNSKLNQSGFEFVSPCLGTLIDHTSLAYLAFNHK
jgi:hypothetical protein